jgi:hypothetical protein
MVYETPSNPDWPHDYWGPAGRSATDITGIGIQWRLGSAYGSFGFRSVTPWPGRVGSVSTYLTVIGEVTAWGSGHGVVNDPSYGCGYKQPPNPPCYSFSGSGAVSLMRVASDLVLTADSTRVRAGSTVTFSISQTEPFVLNGADTVWLSLVGRKAIWVPDDTLHGGLASEQTDSANACTFHGTLATRCTRVVAGSGTLTYVALVNGVEQSKSVHVTATRLCQTGFPEIDNPVMDSVFKDLWKRSNPDAADQLQRHEVGGFIVKTDGTYRFEPFTVLSASSCGIDPDPDVPPPGGAVAFVHTHPWHIGEPMTGCPPWFDQIVIGRRMIKYDDYNGVPSTDDMNTATKVPPKGYAMPGYILDASGINKFGSGLPTDGTRYARCGY